MPSTISDFSLQVKKISSNLGLANNYNNENNYNVSRSNPHKIPVTIDNTGKTVKTNYLVNVVWDTQSRYYVNNDIAWNLNDLRVFDSDGITPLSFWVDGVMTSYTCVFVVIPSLTAISKTIFFEFGNPALSNKSSLNTIVSVLDDDNLELWIKSTQNSGYWQNDSYAGANPAIFNMENQISLSKKQERRAEGQVRFARIPDDIESAPIQLKLNQINGLPALNFTGGGEAFEITGGGFWRSGTTPILTHPSRSSVFVVSKNTTKGANYFNEYLAGTTNSFLFALNTFTGKQVIVKQDVATIVTGTTTVPRGVFVQTGVIYDSITANFRYNGGLDSSIVGATTSYNASTAIGRPGAFVASQIYDGDIAEMLCFSRTLTATEIAIVENYLNAKYKLYSTADMPTVTLGSKVASGNANYTYTSYAPLSNWQAKLSLKNKIFGLQKVEATAKIQNHFSKTLASGINAEGWTNSNQYTEADPLSNLISQISRTKTITTTASVDSVDIRALDLSSNNINDVSSFDITNEVVTTTYNSSNNDYIEFDFAFNSVATISLINSYLRFENVGNTISYQAILSKNQNTLIDGISNKIKIKKSDFTLSGVGNWSDMKFFKCNFQTVSGSQTVWYGNLRLNKNVDQSLEFTPGLPVQLSNSVSSDEALSYFNQNIVNMTIDSQMTDESDINFTLKDYLDYVCELKFEDLPSFPDFAWEYGGSFTSMLPSTGFSVGNPTNNGPFPTYGGVEIKLRTWLTILTKQILGFIFPVGYLDVDLDFILDDIALENVSDFNRNGRFVIYGTDKIGDVLDKILSASLGYISFDPILSKLIMRSGYKMWDNTNYTIAGNQLQIPFAVDPNFIVSYDNDQSTNDYIINRLKFKTKSLTRGDYKRSIEPILELWPNTQIPAGTGKSVIKIYFTKDDFIKNSNFEIQPWALIKVTGFVCAANTTTTIASTDVFALHWGFEGDRLFVEITNTSGFPRYLRQIKISGIVQKQQIYPLPAYNNSEFQFLLEDTESQSKYGIKEIEIDPDFAYPVYNLNRSTFVTETLPLVFQGYAFLYTAFLKEFSTPREVVKASIQYIPQLYVGKTVSINNRQGKQITGNILELTQNSECNQKIVVREIRPPTTFTTTFLNALFFPDLPSYISIPHNAVFNLTGDMTVEAWVYFRTSSLSTFNMIVTKTTGAGATNNTFELRTDATTGLVTFQAFDTALRTLTSSVPITENAWTHVAVSKISGIARLHLNGLGVGSLAIGASNTNTNPVFIGARNDLAATQAMNGYIHDVRFWNVGKTQAQILASYKTRLVGNEANLAAYYKLNESSGTTATDSTVGALNGTLTGFGTPERTPFLAFIN